ncbi:MAG: aspartate dehydrogenase [Methanobacteriaceae archaeon]|nr:aspartate dehydrogenase [Methanobacteriaceae archaeon]
MKVGIIGCGAIANLIVNNILATEKEISIEFFYDRDIERAENLADIANGIAVLSVDELVKNVDLVLEAASPSSVEQHALTILNNGKSMMIMSVGALMDENLRNQMIKAAKDHNAKIYTPSGAILGLDGIKAASIGEIKEAKLTTRKSPRSLGKNVDKEEILFEGKASEAVKKFPYNINVAATLSLACNRDIDVKIIVDPKVNRNVHEVIVIGDFGKFTTTCENLPCTNNPKTSMLAAFSAIKLLKSFNDTLVSGT